MPRVCTICASKACHEIDMALVSGNSSLRTIAGQYRVSRTALSRHINNGHIAQKVQEAKKAHEAVEVDKLLSRIERYQARFEALAKRAQDLGDLEWELKVLHGLKEYLDMEAKATGAYKEKREHSGSVEITGAMADAEVMARARSIIARK